MESLCSQLEMGRNPVGTGSLRENPVNGLPGFWFHHFFFKIFRQKNTILRIYSSYVHILLLIISFCPTFLPKNII